MFLGHTTDKVFNILHSLRITTSLIPGGCTGLLQPLDTAINKPFKEFLHDCTDIYIDEREQKLKQNIDSWTTSEKRIMVTYVVADAWKNFARLNNNLL